MVLAPVHLAHVDHTELWNKRKASACLSNEFAWPLHPIPGKYTSNKTREVYLLLVMGGTGGRIRSLRRLSNMFQHVPKEVPVIACRTAKTLFPVQNATYLVLDTENPRPKLC